MESGWLHMMLMLAIGVPVGVVAVTAGGGVTLGVPVLMLAGVPAGASVIAVKVAMWGSFLTGSIAHATRQPISAARLPRWLWPLCVLGAVAGAQLLSSIDPARVRGLVLIMLIASTMGTFLANRRRDLDRAAPSPARRAAGHLAIVGLAIYSGFFGAGFGVFLIWALVGLHGHTPGSAAALGTRLSLLIATATVSVFVWRGLVPWATTLPLALGCAAGGVLGARATNAMGDKLIRASTWTVSLLVAAKLIIDSW